MRNPGPTKVDQRNHSRDNPTLPDAGGTGTYESHSDSRSTLVPSNFRNLGRDSSIHDRTRHKLMVAILFARSAMID